MQYMLLVYDDPTAWPELAEDQMAAVYEEYAAFGHALADHVQHRNSPAERERRKIEAARRRQRRAAKTTTQLKLAA